jgi:hypothetical protein
MDDYFDTLPVGGEITENSFIIKRTAENVIVKRPILTDAERERRMDAIRYALRRLAVAQARAESNALV